LGGILNTISKPPLTPPKGGELFIFSSLLGEVGRGFKIFLLNLPSPLLKEGNFFFFLLPPFKEGWGGFWCLRIF